MELNKNESIINFIIITTYNEIFRCMEIVLEKNFTYIGANKRKEPIIAIES